MLKVGYKNEQKHALIQTDTLKSSTYFGLKNAAQSGTFSLKLSVPFKTLGVQTIRARTQQKVDFFCIFFITRLLKNRLSFFFKKSQFLSFCRISLHYVHTEYSTKCWSWSPGELVGNVRKSCFTFKVCWWFCGFNSMENSSICSFNQFQLGLMEIQLVFPIKKDSDIDFRFGRKVKIWMTNMNKKGTKHKVIIKHGTGVGLG